MPLATACPGIQSGKGKFYQAGAHTLPRGRP